MSTNPYLQFVDEPVARPPEPDVPQSATGSNPYMQFVDASPEAASPVAAEEAGPDPSFTETFGENRQKRDTQLADTIASLTGLQAQEQEMLGGGSRPLYDPNDNLAQNLLGSAEGAVQIAGNYAARGADLVGQTVMAGLSQLPGKEFMAETASTLANSDIGKTILKGLAIGGDAYTQVAEKYPQETKSLIAGLEVGTVGLPGSTKRATGAVLEEAAELTGDAAKRNRLSRVQKLMTPEDKFKEGSVDETWFGTTTWDPSPRQAANIEEVSKVPTVNPDRTPTFNRARVLENVSVTAKTLDNRIKSAGNPQINKEALMNDLGQLVENLDTAEEALTLMGDAKPVAHKILLRAIELIDDSDGSALGILNARRELDRWITTHGGAKYNIDQVNAKNIAQRMLRNRINETVDASVPSAEVKELLGKQHRLLTGADDLELKAKGMEEKAIPRVIDALSKAGHVGPVGAMAIGGAAGGAMGGVSLAPIATGAAAGYGGWKAYQRLNPQQQRIWLTDAIKHLGKGMKDAEPAVLEQLKTDRLLLIDMLQEIPKSDEEIPENG